MRKPIKSRKLVVVRESRFEEVYHFRVVLVLGAVAGEVETGETCCVFAEFVTPEIAVGLAL